MIKKETLILQIDQPQSISRAVEIVQSGGVIAFPTDTVYGIGVSAFNEEAIEKLYQVKGRSYQKAIPILVSDQEELTRITPPLDQNVKAIIQRFWPGAITLIIPLLKGMPENLSPTQTIGVRIPDFKLTRELLSHTGPLAATSANISGGESTLTAEEVAENLGGMIDLILDGGKTPGGVPSTVLDCTQAEPIILREGPISLDTIKLAIDS
ncbi:MAG: threonylcarbamoyl-AMP synthase [Anaerolineales bacterium]|nr:threonylcarbamoyl-AMP synthase [Anaerolineales bacterium]